MRITESQLRKIIREEMGRISAGLIDFDRLVDPPVGPPPPRDDEPPRRGDRGPIMALYYTRIDEKSGMGGHNFERMLKEIINEMFGEGYLSVRYGSGYDTYEGETDSYVKGDESHYDEIMDAIAVVGPLEDLKALVAAIEEELVADLGPYEPHPDHEIVPLSKPD